MLYTVNHHPALSPKAKAMKQDSTVVFDAQVLMAETLLGLFPPAYTDARVVAQLQLAVVLQVNWQVQYGMDPMVLSGQVVKVQDESVYYREDAGPVNPQAKAIVDTVLAGLGETDSGGVWGPGVTSVRGPVL